MSAAQKNNPIRAALRMEIIRSGLSHPELAEKTGIHTRTLSNVLCGNHRTPSAHHKIEDVLGTPFWSTPEEFSARQQAGQQQHTQPTD